MADLVRRIFVVGEHGQVAQALGRKCGMTGYTVRLSGRATADLRSQWAISAAISNFRPDLVVNAAAYTAVDKAEDDSTQAFVLNRDGARNVAVAAAAVGAPVVHLSTDYVYDGTKPSPYIETDPTYPLGAYGASKLAGERAIAEIGGDYVVLRTSWVCSPDGNNFVKTMLRLASDHDELSVVDDQWGAPTFAADLAQAIVSIGEILLASNNRSGLTGLYHICSSGQTTWCRFARAIMKGSADRGGPSCSVRSITSGEYPTRARRPTNSRLDCSKLARAFGLCLPRWEASLESCLDQLIGTSQRVST
jgi:dTDP-4-dehydrorhamnose reductase